ncbi:hypothetical protein AURDEDRAFT_129472 [Auricularia subglabra TFB-10046 SS5]|nr:hypothetical protein AURDEDRAFT_129472 [Auricularia subglabra TFB-10046 SS5]
MQPVAQRSTTTTTDEQVFTAPAPGGGTDVTKLTTRSHEQTLTVPVRSNTSALRVTTATRTMLRRETHRIAPYSGARPVRVASHTDMMTTVKVTFIPGETRTD